MKTLSIASALLLSTSLGKSKNKFKLGENSEAFMQGEKWNTGFSKATYGNELFYWHVEARKDAEKAPLIIWTSGSPGISSEYALFKEIGPQNYIYENKRGHFEHNPNSWNEFANLLFVDAPVGTGFSKAELTALAWSSEQIAQDYALLIAQFIQKHPQYAGRDLYLAGDGYSGHYLPIFADYIQHYNLSGVNLKGIALGDAWVEPFTQYQSYPTYALEHEMIDNGQYYLLQYGLNFLCEMSMMTEIPLFKSTICEFEIASIAGLYYWPIFNLQNYELPCVALGFCYFDTGLSELFAAKEVRKAIGAKGKYRERNYWAYFLLMIDRDLNFAKYLRNSLDNGVKVLSYTGDKDFLFNFTGNERWTDGLVWKDQEEFQNAEWKQFKDQEGKDAAKYKRYNNFTLLEMKNAGMYVPSDQPKNTFNMMKQWVQNGNFTQLMD